MLVQSRKNFVSFLVVKFLKVVQIFQNISEEMKPIGKSKSNINSICPYLKIYEKGNDCIK